jgi:hypothetical protein
MIGEEIIHRRKEKKTYSVKKKAFRENVERNN